MADSSNTDDQPYALFQQEHQGVIQPKRRNPKTLESQRSWLEKNSPAFEIPQALQSHDSENKCMGGVLNDYKKRWPHWLTSDWMDGLTWKTKSASLFMFCATVTSTVALGDVAARETNGRVGITEYLMLQGVAGVGHSLFAACPLAILRPTGPITAFMTDLYALAERMDSINYYSLLSWVGFFVGFYLILIAAFGWSKYIVLCTRFLHDIYAVFVCTIYISDGIIGVVERFDNVEWASAFFAFYLALFCIIFSLGFYYVDRSTILNQRWRHTIADYAVPLAVVLCVTISYSVKDHVEVDRISMPRNFEPTYQDEYTGERRSWYQGLAADDGSSLWVTMLVSLIAAIPIVALFYIDHLFSCILGQKPELGLQKGEYYHSSMFITGVCNLILPMFGLPFVTASLPHSPQFTKALTDYDKSETPWKVIKVHESRVAPMVVYMLCFGGLLVPAVLEKCPLGVVNGILTFVGLQGILPGTGNQLIDRCVLLLTAPSEFVTRDKNQNGYMELPWKRIHLYTAVQLACLAACWGWRFTGPLAIAFPLVVVAFVPLRLVVLPKIFSEEELRLLDSEGDQSASVLRPESKEQELV
ncbi:Electroneutral sodium bicarbonate exchanger 1 [Seminavis robusta]|uniref:Electroneutral sodium bicarbonate exchanger 1 n=1 Tax=Seminavis robusta TaxID=568900 RepID=A0A9N8DT53_9STRA|nr:Electroneutral sodium bicarbonate exchanger 1 [Seminavis robusta]|eukprot:Sro269_g103940.1 Electroneutral sodium bicarbonate exchanger 1 (586) ;mRNA; f:26062-27918